ncbi:MAG: hypothetical protein K6T85_03015 [Gorillibacterium sp.]|nr:hypothetical protein [Gorillibacterium sp.]
MDREKNTKKKFLFNVDIMVEGYSYGIALETLLHFLNQENFLDYEVKNGIELGQMIRNALAVESHKEHTGNNSSDGAPKASVKVVVQQDAQKAAATQKINSLRADHNAAKKQAAQDATEHANIITHHINPEDKLDLSFLGILESYKTNNTLVRLTILKGKGVKLSIPCRILNYEEATDSLTVYHVDEKKVYQFRLTEVDDLSVNA